MRYCHSPPLDITHELLSRPGSSPGAEMMMSKHFQPLPQTMSGLMARMAALCLVAFGSIMLQGGGHQGEHGHGHGHHKESKHRSASRYDPNPTASGLNPINKKGKRDHWKSRLAFICSTLNSQPYYLKRHTGGRLRLDCAPIQMHRPPLQLQELHETLTASSTRRQQATQAYHTSADPTEIHLF